MKAVADASSLLSLEYMGVLDDVLGIADIYTTGSVNHELKEIAGFRDERSNVAKKILTHISDGKIKCIDIKGEAYPKNASVGQCLSLCISAKIPFLLTDDADAAYILGRTAAQKGIKLRMCASAIVELINARKISPVTAKGKLEELIKKRSWEGGILEVLARKYLEKGKW
jgi:hypothetical protein